MSSADPTKGKHLLMQEHGQQDNKQCKKLKTGSVKTVVSVFSLVSLVAATLIKLLIEKGNSFSVDKIKLDFVRSELAVAVYKHIFCRGFIASEQQEYEMKLCIHKLPDHLFATSFDGGIAGVVDKADFVYLFPVDMFDPSPKDFQRIKSPSVLYICQVKIDHLKMIPVKNIVHSLDVLRVTHSQLDDDVTKMWESSLAEVGCQAFSQLKIVNLSNNKIGPKGAEIIAKMCPMVTDWNLGRNNIGTSGLQAMAQHNAFSMVTKLDFSGNNIGPKGAEILAKACPILTYLNLSQNNIGLAGIESMVKHSSFSMVTHLNFNETNMGDLGAEALAKHNIFSNVVESDFKNNNIT